MERNYSATIIDSSKELTAKEKVMYKDLSDCIRLDAATQGGDVVIKPVAYLVISVHNEKSDDKEYNNYVYVDEDGTRYVSGSTNLFNSFMDIWADMAGCDEEWNLRIYRLPSKNYQGRDFITCSII